MSNDYDDIDAIANSITDNIDKNNGLVEALRVFDTPSHPTRRIRSSDYYDYDNTTEIASTRVTPLAKNGTPLKSLTLLETTGMTIAKPSTRPPAGMVKMESRPPSMNPIPKMGARKLEL